jgi:hypothetical protein
MHDEDSLAIGAIAIDPSDPDTVYAGTGEPVYYLSGGVLQPPGSAVLSWFYAGVGVYKSTDGGDTWALTGDIENDVEHDIFTEDDENVRYRRTFSGDPASWVKSYRPDDEAADPENLTDWRIWYKIERA